MFHRVFLSFVLIIRFNGGPVGIFPEHLPWPQLIYRIFILGLRGKTRGK